MGEMKRKILFFTAPGKVELREEVLPPLNPNEVLVETVCSALSAGTEMLVYRGQFPHLVDSHDDLSSNLNYPTAYGYACVGYIKELGIQVDKTLLGKLVFGFAPHTSAFVCNPASLIFPPESFPAEACCFLPNMETAVNLIQDGAPILGERVLVLGQGVVGLLVASLLKEFPLEMLVTSDCYAIRRKASLSAGANHSFDPESIHGQNNDNKKNTLDTTLSDPTDLFAYTQSFDLTFELSGSPSALNDAIAMTAFSGRIVIGSWYGEKKTPIDLGSTFHRSRIKLISSQVSTIAPELSGRWDKTRRFGVAWEALKRIQPQKWITHRFSIEEAEKSYELIDKNPQETIQVVLDYKS
jgi:2-desacetyl-2-hydroxyethyl bacteriochlorophyllide A dehydrogenase